MLFGPTLDLITRTADILMAAYQHADQFRDGLCSMPPIKIEKSLMGFDTGSATVHVCPALDGRWDFVMSQEIDKFVDAYADTLEYQMMVQQEVTEAILWSKATFPDLISFEAVEEA